MINLQIAAAFAEADEKSIAAIPAYIKEKRDDFNKLREELRDTKGETVNTAFGECYVSPYEVITQTLMNKFGKGFYNDCRSCGLNDHIVREVKITRQTHEKRNHRIAAKMEKAGIKSIDVDDFKIIYGTDFSGAWIIDGHRVTLKVIWAGGYNIQCLHHRVLCHIKQAA